MTRAARGTRSARAAGEEEAAEEVPDLATTSPPAAAHFHSSKDAKAAARKEAHAKAKEWRDLRHAKGKDKEDDDEGEDVKTPDRSDPGADVEGREEAVAEPPRTTRRSTRARRATLAPRDDKENVSDDSSMTSVSSRRSSRRRTMGSASENIVVASGSAEKTAEKAAPTPRRSRRKTSSRKRTPSPVAEEEEDEKQEESGEVAVANAEEEGKEEEQEEKEEAENEEGQVEAKEEKKKDEETKAEEEVKDDEEDTAQEVPVKPEEVSSETVVVKEETEDHLAQEETAVKMEEEEAGEETAVVKQGTNPETHPEGEKEVAPPQKVAEKAEAQAKGGVITTEEGNGVVTEASDTLFMQYLPAYFHALLVMWTLAFAVMISPIGFDWYLSHYGGEDDSIAMSEAQRGPCAALALWLGTIAFWILAVGPQSGTGWAIAGLSLVAASYSTRFVADDTTIPVPLLPLPLYAGYQIRVPDLLIAACYYGWLALHLCPRPAGTVPAPGLPQAPSLTDEVMPPDQERVNETQAEQFGGTEAGASVLSEDMGGRLFIGKRVAIFGCAGEARLGTVDDYDLVEKEWSVRFDDSSAEEDELMTLNRVSLGSALKLHAKVLADELKAMWLGNML